jgi:hypothetical protein
MTHAVVNKQETRKLKEIVEIINVNPKGIALTNTPFKWNPIEDNFYFKSNSRIFEKISLRYGLRIEELDLEFRRRTQLLYRLYQKKVFKFKDVQEIINRYHKQPEIVLREFGIN